MRLRKHLALGLALELAAGPSWGVAHLKPGTYPHAFQDQIHHPTAAQITKFGSMRAAIIGTTTGPHNVAVIIVQFPAGNNSLISRCPNNALPTCSRNIQSLANIDTYFNQMKAYYNEVSYGKIALTFKFFGGSTNTSDGDTTAAVAGFYTLTNPMEYYGCGDEGVGCGPGVPTPTPGTVNAFGDYLIRDALIAARGGHSNTPGTPGSGDIFDAVIVVHAGNGNETTSGTNGDIWSIFYSQDNVITSAGGGFTEGDVVPETEGATITSPLGVMCHEFGHELGLPDQYNTLAQGGTSVVGSWELMDAGPFDGNGANPSHMGIWDKVSLGWATPQTITSQGTVHLGYVETAGNSTTGSLRLATPNGLAQEYFLVEYRSRSATGTTYDHNIPGDGLLIWHIDDAITSTRGIAATDPALSNTVNTGSPHDGISIVAKDGVVISNSNQGDAGNAFGNGDIFISPKSDNFAGQPSGVSMVNISGVGSTIVTAQVASLAVSAGQSIIKLVNYPNPAGKGYAHPSGEGHSTIQFQLTRPAQDYSINIYTLSADLVRKIGKDDITLNITRSADDKWVYEYEWDLKNGNGQHVAPGVYLYLIRADGEHQSGKAVIIR